MAPRKQPPRQATRRRRGATTRSWWPWRIRARRAPRWRRRAPSSPPIPERERLLVQAVLLAHARHALRAEAVAELGVGVIAHVDLHGQPGAVGAVDPLAIEADGDDAGERRMTALLRHVHERHGHAVGRVVAGADQRMGTHRNPRALAALAQNAHYQAW